MNDLEFENLSRQIGAVVDDLAAELTGRGGVVAIASPRHPRDGCLLTIKKSTNPVAQDIGSFAIANDSSADMLRLQFSGSRVNAGAIRVQRIQKSDATRGKIRDEVRNFVDAWLL